MTKKDYIKVADVLKSEKERLEHDLDTEGDVYPRAIVEWSIITGKISYMLSQDNPRFDRDRFLKACGYS